MIKTNIENDFSSGEEKEGRNDMTSEILIRTHKMYTHTSPSPHAYNRTYTLHHKYQKSTYSCCTYKYKLTNHVSHQQMQTTTHLDIKFSHFATVNFSAYAVIVPVGLCDAGLEEFDLVHQSFMLALSVREIL